MLRITTAEDSHATTFRLEGKLAGPWVRELEECWRSGASAAMHRGLRIDLREVTFIDAAGKKLLARLHQDGAELVAADCMTKAIIETITRAPHRSNFKAVWQPRLIRPPVTNAVRPLSWRYAGSEYCRCWVLNSPHGEHRERDCG